LDAQRTQPSMVIKLYRYTHFSVSIQNHTAAVVFVIVLARRLALLLVYEAEQHREKF